MISVLKVIEQGTENNRRASYKELNSFALPDCGVNISSVIGN